MIQNLKSSTEKNIILLKKRALYYLGKREYSRLELHKKINAFAQELELETQDIKAILNDLEGNNWLSDQRFTEQFILSKKNKYGVEKIRYELKVRGVADTIINTELVKIKTENYSLAKKIWAKKFDGAPKSLEERNKQKTAYKPSELEPRTQLNEKDFLFTNQEERKLLLEQTYQLGKKLAIKYKRFIKDSNKGHLHFRRTIRKSLESGGSFEKLIFKPRVKKKPKLTILCDISGSMALNSLFGVTLLYGMVSKFKSIKAFVFIDGATEISKTLRLIKKNEIEKNRDYRMDSMQMKVDEYKEQKNEIIKSINSSWLINFSILFTKYS